MYNEAKEKYAALGVDTELAMERLMKAPVSLHCWQGDDVRGFDTDPTKPLTGGIQTTGNYPGRARTPEELMADLDMVLKLCPGMKKLNLHANYAIFDDENGGWVDRDKLEPKHFKKWVDFCKERGLGCDFNPTFFSHPKCDPLTLSSPNEETRRFWIDHGKACIRISQYLAEELGQPCVMNIWTGDGFKDIPADRMGPRMRYKESIDEILSEPFDFNKVKPCVESKVFGIGVEAYTVGSAEFSLSYAAANPGKCIPLMDNGHYHPTEVVSDKIPALLVFFPEIALHITRPVRWDSDHVVLFDDETREMAKEIVRCGGLDGSVKMALDYFDASVNRVAAWTLGFRNWQKALLNALLTPSDSLKADQDAGNLTAVLVRQDELKTMPFGDVWDEYCRRCGAPLDGTWLDTVLQYERDVLSKR
ncbi:MAG: L-rhamnose isomerase [Pseudoflavonifractor capillosus]|uniref:L-rhamnose isomerase n=1 Tax=Pseudoflavonifractor capillosus TaxID=106588 RepID=UPI0023F75161|nr:L-rhamnose isomerase [Pseudoflavonifractor capillosus]MCI5927872.1 L-rhamnose isomerase [Pseudoflavonifractor capillosus]MDY4662147.1 L-rhamnose isomerase [Pseudoflavonifractor capillosus]